MKKRVICCVMLAMFVILSSCGNIANKAESINDNNSEDLSEEDTQLAGRESDESIESVLDGYNTGMFGAEEGLYDRSYLMEKDGKYIYMLTNQEIIKEYDELYADAFQDVIDSYKEVMEYQNQSVDINQSPVVTNLVYSKSNKVDVVTTGSYFEWDYGFDLNNVGYTYVDLNSDGIFELIFGVNDDSSTEEYESYAENRFERAYALIDGKPVKFIEGGSRILFWLGSDGYIYEYGSGGAAYSGYYRLHFDINQLEVYGETEWGDGGLIEDEFVGWWGYPTHILFPVENMDAAAEMPENQLTDDELSELYDDWDSKRVHIQWMRLTDYLAKYNIKEI